MRVAILDHGISLLAAAMVAETERLKSATTQTYRKGSVTLKVIRTPGPHYEKIRYELVRR